MISVRPCPSPAPSSLPESQSQVVRKLPISSFCHLAHRHQVPTMCCRDGTYGWSSSAAGSLQPRCPFWLGSSAQKTSESSSMSPHPHPLWERREAGFPGAQPCSVTDLQGHHALLRK